MRILYTDILKKGRFLYDDIIPLSVIILKQNWDFYYEEGYDSGGESLDDDGFAYYVIYGEYDDLLYANRSKTCLSEIEAIQLAEETTNSKVVWE